VLAVRRDECESQGGQFVLHCGEQVFRPGPLLGFRVVLDLDRAVAVGPAQRGGQRGLRWELADQDVQFPPGQPVGVAPQVEQVDVVPALQVGF
jgi:hypothetical protein